MDALIATFVEELKQRAALYSDDQEGNIFNDGTSSETDGELKARITSGSSISRFISGAY